MNEYKLDPKDTLILRAAMTIIEALADGIDESVEQLTPKEILRAYDKGREFMFVNDAAQALRDVLYEVLDLDWVSGYDDEDDDPRDRITVTPDAEVALEAELAAAREELAMARSSLAFQVSETQAARREIAEVVASRKA